MIPFYWYDIIIIPGIAQGIFLALYIRLNKTNQSANRVLAWILGMAAFMLVGRVIWNRYPAEWDIQLSLIGDTPIFLFGPLFLLYVKRLLFNEKRNSLPWYHAIPVFIHFIFIGVFSFMTESEYLISANNGAFVSWYLFLIEGASILLIIGYLVQSIRYVISYRNKEREHIAHEQSAIRFLEISQVIFGICLAVWITSYLSQYAMGRYSPVGYDAIWISISVWIYAVGYFGLKQPELLKVSISTTSAPDKSNRLDDATISVLKERLKEQVMGEKVFLQNDLTLGKLAHLVDATPNNVSWLINEVDGKSFYDYINHYRVQAFVDKVYRNEHRHKTILALAMEVGFNSKSTFNKAFRMEMGDTPSNYINGLTTTVVTKEGELIGAK